MSAIIAHKELLREKKYIHNHDIMTCTADGVIGNHLYSGRALGISEPWDMIQLHPELESQWEEITQHYKRIGLSHTEDVIWYLDLKQLGAHIDFQPSVFYFGPEECQYWGDYEWLNTVEFINSKNNFISLANELGVDVPKTCCFARLNDITPAVANDFIYPCYLKAAVSVAGVGIYRCDNMNELLVSLANFTEVVPVQVQEEVKTETFLNLQYKVVGDEVIRLAASEQILDGYTHQGNRFPAAFEPWNLVEPMANWLAEQGMKGIFAFDVAVVQTDKGLRFPAIECNPRFNGASYPTLIAQKLSIPEWSTNTFITTHRSLEYINLDDLEYDHKTKEGAVLVNWGTILEGKLTILMAGSIAYQEALTEELRARL